MFLKIRCKCNFVGLSAKLWVSPGELKAYDGIYIFAKRKMVFGHRPQKVKNLPEIVMFCFVGQPLRRGVCEPRSLA